MTIRETAIRVTLPLFLLLMFSATLRSQIQPCVPDCFDNPFQGPFYHQIIVGGPCGSCPINVEYYTRIACPGSSNFQDFQITGVVAIAGNPCIACPIGPIIQEATLALIRDNPMGFVPVDPVDRGRCFSNWRVSAAPCWKGVQDGSTKPYPPFDRIEPCSRARLLLATIRSVPARGRLEDRSIDRRRIDRRDLPDHDLLHACL